MQHPIFENNHVGTKHHQPFAPTKPRSHAAIKRLQRHCFGDTKRERSRGRAHRRKRLAHAHAAHCRHRVNCPPQALPKFLQGDLPNFNDLAVEGDMELGMNVMFCFAQIRYAPHQDLRQLLGDDTADKLTAKAAKIGKTLQIVGQTLLFQAASINQASEQARMQHSQMHETLNDCVDELDDLRNEIRIINKRLEQLESSLKSYD